MFRLLFFCAIVGAQIGHSFASPCTCTDHKLIVNSVNASTELNFEEKPSIPETTALEASSIRSIVEDSSSNTSVSGIPANSVNASTESNFEERSSIPETTALEASSIRSIVEDSSSNTSVSGIPANSMNASTESNFEEKSSIPASEASSIRSIVEDSSSDTSVSGIPAITSPVFVELSVEKNESRPMSSATQVSPSYEEVQSIPIDSVEDAYIQSSFGRDKVGSIDLASNSCEENVFGSIYSVTNSDNNSTDLTPKSSSTFATMDDATRGNLAVLVTDEVSGLIAEESLGLSEDDVDSRYSTEAFEKIGNSTPVRLFIYENVKEVGATNPTTEESLISSNHTTTNHVSSQKVGDMSFTTDISISVTDLSVEETESGILNWTSDGVSHHEDVIQIHSTVIQAPERAVSDPASSTIDDVSPFSPGEEFLVDYVNLPEFGSRSINVTTEDLRPSLEEIVNFSTLPNTEPSSWIFDQVSLHERDHFNLSNSTTKKYVEKNTDYLTSATTDDVSALYSVDNFPSSVTDQILSTISIDAQISENTSTDKVFSQKSGNELTSSSTNSSIQENESRSSNWMTNGSTFSEVFSLKSTTEENFNCREDETDSNRSTVVYSSARPCRNDSIDFFTKDGISASSTFSTLDDSILGTRNTSRNLVSDGISDHKENNTGLDYSSTHQSFEKRTDYYTSSTFVEVSDANIFPTTISDGGSTISYTVPKKFENGSTNSVQNSSVLPFWTFDEVLMYEKDSANSNRSTTSQSFETLSMNSILSTSPSAYPMEYSLLGQKEGKIDSIDHSLEEIQTTSLNSTTDSVICTSVSPITDNSVLNSKFNSIIASFDKQVDFDVTHFPTEDTVMNSSTSLATSTIMDYDHTRVADSKDGKSDKNSSLARDCSKLIFSEIMCIASATSCIHKFEADVSTNKTLQAIAIASSNLWVKLSTMKRVNEIYLNASMLPIEIFQNLNITNELDMIERLPSDIMSHLVLNKIDVSLKANYGLRKSYLEEMDKIEVQKLPALEGIDDFLLKKSRLPSFVVNQYFLANADGLLLLSVKNKILSDGEETEFFERYLMAQAVLHLSIWEDTKVQRIYDEAVNRSVQTCAFLKNIHELATVQDVYTLQEVLFSALDEGFAKDTELNAELVEAKNMFRDSEPAKF